MDKLTNTSIALGALCAVPVALAALFGMPLATIGALAVAGIVINLLFAALEPRLRNGQRATELPDALESAGLGIGLSTWIAAAAVAIVVYGLALWLVT